MKGGASMALYLVQHGISLAKDADPGRGLSEHGISETQRVARRAGDLRIHVSEIIHSGKNRARRTAEIFADRLTPGKEPSLSAGLNPLDDVEPIAQAFAERPDLMIVGHLPFLERLASFLIVGTAEIPVVGFTNSGIVCLDRREREPGRRIWVVRWVLAPEIA
jgi:phosphohistidine phosphatase